MGIIILWTTRQLLLYSTETRIQKCHSSLLLMKCLNDHNASLGNSFRKSSCNLNDKANILTGFQGN